MKILKPGKVKTKKFVCKKCECEFTANLSDVTYSVALWVQCPCCKKMMVWSDGEHYEEPVLPTQSDLERLAELLQYDGASWSSMDLADFLLSHGVTFREE